MLPEEKRSVRIDGLVYPVHLRSSQPTGCRIIHHPAASQFHSRAPCPRSAAGGRRRAADRSEFQMNIRYPAIIKPQEASGYLVRNRFTA
jgi:hypothetical protein